MFHRKIVEIRITRHRHLLQQTSVIDQNFKKNDDLFKKSFFIKKFNHGDVGEGQ
jgi:hypothetical protein